MVHGTGREVLMGEGNGVASVIMLTFTKMPGPRKIKGRKHRRWKTTDTFILFFCYWKQT